MKMSVYVPDELWEEVQAQDKDLRISQFLQQTLRDRYGARSKRPYATLGEFESRNADVARKAILKQLTEAYRVGYQLGIDFATELPWQAFRDFFDLDWDAAAWRKDFDEREYELTQQENADGTPFVADWDISMDFLFMDHESVPVSADGVPKGIWGEGFVDAIRDVWEGRSVEARLEQAPGKGSDENSGGEEDSDGDS